MIVGILFLTVGLSGCTENNNNPNYSLDGLEIIDYSVYTQWRLGNQEYQKEGFYHDIPEYAYSIKYYINGTIKNNAGKKIDAFWIVVRFYDEDNNELNARQKFFQNLPNNYTMDFSFEYPDAWGGGYFFDIDHIIFETNKESIQGIQQQW